MKCPTCGANLQIEDEKCPFCGNPNPFAVKHRQDMKHYHQEFQKTKNEVEQKTNRFTFVTVKVTVIIVLIVLTVGVSYLKEDGYYRIEANRIRRDIEKNRQSYNAQMAAYEEEKDWLGMYAFYNAKELYYDSESFREYMAVYNASFNYKGVLDYAPCGRSNTDYYNAGNVSRWLAEYLDRFYDYEQRISYSSDYYDASYAPEHMEALACMREDLDAVLMAYCHLTKEELELLPDYSTAKKQSLLEEGLLRENVDENKGEETEE